MEIGNGSLGFNKNTTDKKLTKKVENLEKRIAILSPTNKILNIESVYDFPEVMAIRKINLFVHLHPS